MIYKTCEFEPKTTFHDRNLNICQKCNGRKDDHLFPPQEFDIDLKAELNDPDADQYREAFKRAADANFQPVDVETGWRVCFGDLWVQKKHNDQKRLYASEAAARKRTEQEFFYDFIKQFRETNDEVERKVFLTRGPITELRTAETRAFRRFMNWVYAQGLIRYEEVV